MTNPHFASTNKIIILATCITLVGIILTCSLLFVSTPDNRSAESATATYEGTNITVTYDSSCYTVSSAEVTRSGNWDDTAAISITIVPTTGYYWSVASGVSATCEYTSPVGGSGSKSKDIALTRSENVWSGSASLGVLVSITSTTVTFDASLVSGIEYTVAYNGNGSTSGSTASSTHTYGVSKALTTNGFSRTGYTFAGWATSSTGSVVYSDGQSVSNLTTTDGATVTLYAVWTANTYTVKYNGNGYTSGSTASSTHTYGVSKALTSNGFKKTGYTFAGWATSSSGSVVYSDGQSVSNLTSTNGATVNLYAKWTANTYTVKYNGNGYTSGSTASSSHTYGVSKALTSNGFVKTGYTFAGWAKSSTGSVVYSDGQSVSNLTSTKGGTVTLYARWQSTINLDQQSGTGGTTSITGIYNSSMPTATAPTFAGFTFGGYYSSVGGQGTQYYDADMVSAHTYDLVSGSTLYACWTSTGIILDLQGGINGTTSIDGTYNLDMPAITVPTRNSYTFDGFYSAVGGGGTQYYTVDGLSAHTYDLPSGTTLYAKWVCTIILDMQSGTGGSASANPIYNASMPSATAPSRTGWEFGGYFTQIAGGGTQYYTKDMTSAKIWVESTNITLYAKWTTQITLSKSGGTGGSDYVVIIFNAPMPTAIAPTRTGYVFGGYYTESNGNGTRFYTETMASAQNWNLSQGTALYAKWIANVYTVTFEYNGATGGNDIATKTVNFGSFYSDLPQPTKSGATFGGWYLESTFDTIVTNTTVVEATGDHTLYARWTSWLVIHVSGTSNSVDYISQINDLNTTASVDIYPNEGQYVSTISFDNVNFYTISYTDFTFSDLDFALKLSYCASSKNNYIGIDIEHIYPNYFESVGSIHIYLVMMSTPYERLVTSSGGASVTGVAVGATFGGTAYIMGYDYENMADTDLITLVAKVTQENYYFVGWYAADNVSICLSTDESATIKKSIVYERQIIAKFALIGSNPDVNNDLNNI